MQLIFNALQNRVKVQNKHTNLMHFHWIAPFPRLSPGSNSIVNELGDAEGELSKKLHRCNFTGTVDVYGKKNINYK